MKQLKACIYMQALTTICTKITAIFFTNGTSSHRSRRRIIPYAIWTYLISHFESTGWTTSDIHDLRRRPSDHNADHSSTEFLLGKDFTKNDPIYTSTINKCDIFNAFMISGQYHFFPRITGFRLDKVRSSRLTPPIPRLYAAITANWVMFPLPFPLIHLLVFPTVSTPYALRPMLTIELSFHRTISRLFVLLKSYDPLSLFFISLTSANGYFSIRLFLMLPVVLNSLVSKSTSS